MTEHARCPDCGVLDALGRHDPACPHALNIGLPRLAEGEDPIDPREEEPTREMTTFMPTPEDPNEESGYDGPIAEEGEVSPNHPAHPQWHGAPQEDIREYRDDGERWREQPQHMIRAEAMGRAVDALTFPDIELWFAHPPNDGKTEFDCVIFDTEIGALRFAVEAGWRVRPLQLGESLRDQVEGATGASLPQDER
jgi:hypothetical protein